MTCAFQSLRSAESQAEARRATKIRSKVLLEVLFPLGLAVTLTVVLGIVDSSIKEWREIFFGDILKICSLFVIGAHTLNAVKDVSSFPKDADNRAVFYYQLVGGGTLLVAIALVVHASLLIMKPDSVWAHSPLVLLGTSTLSCLYLFGFLAGNLAFKAANPENWGIKRFSDAFIWGANVPFISAFIIILVVAISAYFVGFAGQLESFLVGAVTFLILSSTVANICMDNYARPFLAVGDPVLSVAPICAHERQSPPPTLGPGSHPHLGARPFA